MDQLTVDGWTIVDTRTYSAALVRVTIADGHGHRLSLMVPSGASTYDELAPLIRARVEIAGRLPPEGPAGSGD